MKNYNKPIITEIKVELEDIIANSPLGTNQAGDVRRSFFFN